MVGSPILFLLAEIRASSPPLSPRMGIFYSPTELNLINTTANTRTTANAYLTKATSVSEACVGGVLVAASRWMNS